MTCRMINGMPQRESLLHTFIKEGNLPIQTERVEMKAGSSDFMSEWGGFTKEISYPHIMMVGSPSTLRV